MSSGAGERHALAGRDPTHIINPPHFFFSHTYPWETGKGVRSREELGTWELVLLLPLSGAGWM